MKARFLLSLLLLLVGIGLPIAAVSSNGVPWGFQGRAAVVIDAVGAVEIYPGDANPERLASGAIPAAPGTGLYPGDEVRVGALSEALLRLEQGDVTLADGSRVRLAESGIGLVRGVVLTEVRRGAFVVDLPASQAAVTLLPGKHTLYADAKKSSTIFVQEGTAHARSGGGESVLQAGQVAHLERDQKTQVSAPTPSITCRVRCRPAAAGAIAEGEAPTGGLALVNGQFVATEKGRFSVPLAVDSGDVTLFARAPWGAVCKARARCEP